MAPPSKRRKFDCCSSGYNILKTKVELVSSSPSRPSEPNNINTASDRNEILAKRSKEPRTQAGITGSHTSIPSYSIASLRNTKITENITKNSLGDLAHNLKVEKVKDKKHNGLNNHFKGVDTDLQASKAISEADFDYISDWDEDELGFCQISSSVLHSIAKNRSSHSQPRPLKNGKKGLNKFLQKTITQEEYEKDLRPWAERFGPSSLDELAVHKRKVADVRKWLEDAMSSIIRQRLLLLKGAPGSGKTTTVRLLAESLGYQILEWHNPVGPLASSDGLLSMSAQFDEFLGKGGRFRQLDLFSSKESVSTKRKEELPDARRSIILIEEFPSTFASSSLILQSFQRSLLQYITCSSTPLFTNCNKSTNSTVPVVIIFSESPLTTFNSADNFTAHRLLGPLVIQHPSVRIIEFNPVAPSLIAKALDLIVQKESQKSGRKKIPGPMVLKKLGETGDIRGAAGSLEFLCLRGDTDGDWSARVSFGRSKSKNKEITMTKMEKESLELINQREVSLGIFHAVGKVIYNRRQNSPSTLPVDQNPERLPNHLYIHSRPKKSLVSVNELMDEIGTDVHTFIAALHENYLLSCDAAPSCFEFSSLDHVSGCIDALSDSDLICSSWNSAVNNTSLSKDSLYRDEIGFQTAVRGLLFSLPNPVTRKVPTSTCGSQNAKARDAHCMFYPTSLRLWREREEMKSIIDLWISRLQNGTQDSTRRIMEDMNSSKMNYGIVETWKSPQSKSTGGVTNTTSFTMVSNLSRKEMLLERLPYMAKILKFKRTTNSIIATKEIEKVTTFAGIGSIKESLDANHDTEIEDKRWISNESNHNELLMNCNKLLGKSSGTESLPIQQPEQKHLLSDDDIEDF
ncbi:Cell cycle checkpoint protein RAD17 [Golovinomyces cichoracearum]|uniref:Cell cycle checkpoint protein RAD17 n=1 Tax=Golovinomyces cichoracearum TaxID=62708 RepID=A0A420J740_9PEZI|nr:Cell cycle checkpoint protein RAD17 [Golovinomyces cichoracearum]